MRNRGKLCLIICIVVCIILLCLSLVACKNEDTSTVPTPPFDNVDKPLEKPKPDVPTTNNTLTIYYIDMGLTTAVEYIDQDIIVLLVPKERNGFTFMYWLAEDGSPIINTSINNNSSVNSITLKAEWATIDYTLKLKYNDGSNNVTEQLYNINTDNYVLPVPSRTGYDFLGWFNGSYTAPINKINRGTTGYLELTAKWKTQTYSIVYSNVDEGFSAKEEYNITTNDFTLPIPTRERCEFLGWYKHEGLSGDRIYSVPKGSSGDLTLFAKWSAPKYNIAYEMFGGSAIGLVNSYSKDSQPINVDKVTPVKSGFKFLGWFRHPDCIDETKIISIDNNDKIDYKLFAAWTTESATSNVEYSTLKCSAPNKDSLNLTDHESCHYTVKGTIQTLGNVFNIANTYKSKPVKAVERLAFQSLKGATVNVPTNVTSIADEVFRDCAENTTINFSPGLKSIGNKCFYNASKISTIIPSSIGDKLGTEVFAKTKNCTFTIQEGVTALPYQAFNLATIGEILLPVSIESLGDNAFAGATVTSRIKLGGKITYWGGGLFTNSKINRLDIDRLQTTITFSSLLDLYDFDNDFFTPVSLSYSLINYITSEIYFRIMGFNNANFRVNFDCSTVNANASLLGHYSSNEFTHTLEEVCITRKNDNNINGIKNNYIMDLKSFNTVVHETRHYFQNLCFKKKIKTITSAKIPYALMPSAQEIATWNPDDYISATNSPEKYAEYYHQPVEEDARRVATEITGYLPKHTSCPLCPAKTA